MVQQRYMMQNLHQMKTVSLDRATEVKLNIVELNEEVSDYKGIWNTTQGRLANVVSKNYQIIQHDDVVTSVVETLSTLGLEVKGRMGFYKDTMDIRLVFKGRDDLVIKDDTPQGVMLGMRILNSYDKKTSFRLEMYGVRMYCENGMVLGKAMNNVRSTTVHLGELKTKAIISSIVETFVAEMINSSQKLQEHVNMSMVDNITFNNAKQIISGIINTEKHSKKILEALGDNNRDITRWDLYNLLTSYTTHNEELTPYVENHLQSIAQDVLVMSSDRLLAENPMVIPNEA